MEEEASLSQSRSKRQKIDRSGKSSAFERLKSLKGKKNKLEVGEVENVYDEVDEKEYSRRVLERQDEDWLEGPGDGYIEDGREIFDEEEEEEHIYEPSKKSKSSKKKNLSEKSHKSSKNILHMVANMPTKRKRIDDDNILNDLMGELSSDNKTSTPKSESLSSKDYLKSISNLQHKKRTPTTIPQSSSSQITQNNKKPEEVTTKTYDVTTTPKKSISLENSSQEEKTHTIKPNLNDSSASCFTDNTAIDVTEHTAEEIEVFESDFVVSENTRKTQSEECFNDLKLDDFADSFEMANQENISVNIGEKSTEELLNDGWETSSQNINISLENINIDKSNLPLVDNEEGEKVFRFFWWDAYEDPFKQPGTVYLFGKVYHKTEKTFMSCCVCVENIERRIFLLPREKKFDLKTNTSIDTPVTLLDVYQEFNDKVANPNKIMNFKSRKVTRKYAFELKDVPEESDYLEIKYPSNFVKLSHELSGETFSRVFGTNTTSLELFLLEQKIKGPCWLDVKNPKIVNTQCSWCKIETRCLTPEDVVVSQEKSPPPPLLIMTINIRSVVNSKTMENEIVMISSLVHNSYRIDKPAPKPLFNSHFCAVTKPSGVVFPPDFENSIPKYKKTKILMHQSERSLLNFFLTKLYITDPDVIIGHDLYGFTLDTLVHRIQNFKISFWSRIGRLKRAVMPQLKGKLSDKSITCGRLVCDINISAKELIRARSYDLDTLCKQILNLKEDSRQDFSTEEIVEKYEKSSSLFSLVGATMSDTSYILRLMYELNVLPLALQITNIAGNVMSRTLLGGRSERNEFLLLHAFTEKNYIVPDKSYSKKAASVDEEVEMAPKSSKRKPQYAGGLVLEPKIGFYDKLILLMDFNSLYPSIIQEYNICFTTISREGNDELVPELPCEDSELGILPTEIQKLVESRRKVKTLMKTNVSPELYMQYNIRQMALKLTANSMYGCLGFSFSRFYAKPLAALVTSRGREILMNTKDIVQKMNFEVIYGDTDSIMINTNCTNYDDVFKIGHCIKQEINKLYKYVELEVDGVFKYMLLLKKKKYAAVVLSKNPNGEVISTQEYKGLDIVRRDWCQLSAEVGRHILNQILSDLNPEERIENIREHLERIAEDMRNKVVPLSLLAITKQLNKNPEDYPEKKSLPHLQVALRMNSKVGGKKFKAGDTVSYVICDDGSNLPALQRAYHLDELKTKENLLIDVNYYLSQQIHPVVSRLCEPMSGTDPAFIAECLGLDPNSYKKTIKKVYEEENTEDGEYMLINDIQSFKLCEKFSFTCINEGCKTKIFMDGPMKDNHPILSKCRNPSCNTSPLEYLPSILNALNMSIRRNVEKLYQNWMVCEDPACPNQTQRVPMMFSNSFPVCTMCKKTLMYREYRNADLYYQLKFYEFIFNIKRLKIQMEPELENAYEILHERAVQALNQSAYRILDFSKIFKFMMKVNKKKEKVLEKSLMNNQQF